MDSGSSIASCDKKKIVIAGEIDSTSGVNFAEVLGALDSSSLGAKSSKKCDKKERRDHKSKAVSSSSSNGTKDVLGKRNGTHIDIHDKYKKSSKSGKSSLTFTLPTPTPAVNICPNYKPILPASMLSPKKKTMAIALDANDLNSTYWEDSRTLPQTKALTDRQTEEDAWASMMCNKIAR